MKDYGEYEWGRERERERETDDRETEGRERVLKDEEDVCMLYIYIWR
jgi:hypothetical protein